MVYATKMKRRHSVSRIPTDLGSFGSVKRQRYNLQKAIDRRAKRGTSLLKQVKALVASKKRDGADVIRDTASQSVTTISCLTSSTAFATAASGTGLLDMTGDEGLINSVRIKGNVRCGAAADGSPAGNFPNRIRLLTVWFNKPLLVASAAGTLPPVTEVLVTDHIDSLPVTAASNGGRFVILSDRMYVVGMNITETTTFNSQIAGPCIQPFDYTVKVGKMCKFKAPSDAGATAGGHYDSDVSAGQVDRGLLIQYRLVEIGSGSMSILSTTRINYTG